MPHQQAVSDPFALMMNPEAVVQAMERSDRLKQLKRRVCRPLDKPLIARAVPEADELDQELDAITVTDDFENEFDATPESSDLSSAIEAMPGPDDA
jgi:hypothetical protein